MVKRIICGLLILAVALSSSCTIVETPIRWEMMRYLEKKYDEKFVEIQFSRPDFMTRPYYSMTVSPKDNEDIIFGVRRTSDGDYIFDTYVIQLLKPELEKTAEDIIKKYFSDYKLWFGYGRSYNDNDLPYQYGKDTTLDDLIELCKTRLTILSFTTIVYIEYDSSDSSEIEKCMNEITAKCANPSLDFFTVFPEYYEKIDNDISEDGFDLFGYEGEWYDERFSQRLLSEDELIELIEEVEKYD